MGTRAIILFALILFFAALFLAGFAAVVRGVVRKRKQALARGVLLCTFSACLILLASIYAGALGVRRAYTAARAYKTQAGRDLKEFFDPSPATRFTQVTGLELPTNARVLANYYDDWLFDWQSYTVFEADQEDSEAWVSGPPPFGAAEWIRGPVPREVLLCCSGPTWDDLRPERLMTSDKVWYAAEQTCCEDLRYHGGELMIIDPELSRVWVAAWDH